MTDTPTVHEALLAAQRAVRPVGRDARNPQQGWAYRSVDALLTAGRQALVDAGVLTVLREAHPPVLSGTLLQQEFVLVCTGPAGDEYRHPVTAWLDVRGGAAQALGSLQSYAWKMALVGLLAIAYADDDPDGHPLPVDQPATKKRATPSRPASDRQKKLLWVRAKERGYADSKELAAWAAGHLGVVDVDQVDLSALTAQECSALIDALADVPTATRHTDPGDDPWAAHPAATPGGQADR